MLDDSYMLWFRLLVFLVVCTAALMVVLEAYAWFLRRVAKLPRPLPLLLGLLCYLVVAFAFALPLFGLQILLGFGAATSEFVRWVGMLGYLLSLLLAVLFFRYRHLDALKSLGYFQPRSPR